MLNSVLINWWSTSGSDAMCVRIRQTVGFSYSVKGEEKVGAEGGLGSGIRERMGIEEGQWKGPRSGARAGAGAGVGAGMGVKMARWVKRDAVLNVVMRTEIGTRTESRTMTKINTESHHI